MKSVLTILITLVIAFITPPAFAVNSVLSLDGDGDYVEIADSEALNAINSQVTMEAWIKATAFPDVWMHIIYKGDKGPFANFKNRSYGLWLQNDGKLVLASTPSDLNAQIGLKTQIGLIVLDTWHHVTGVIDGQSGVMKILINGAEVASGGFGKDIRVSSLPLRIGWTHEENALDPTYSPFAGQIDEVRIWNVAHTQEEIKTTMHTTLSGKEPGLVGYWQFDDGKNIAADSSPNHSDGKLMGDAHIAEAELPTESELVIPTVLSGMITDEAGKPIPNVSVRLEKDDLEISQTQTDASGSYRIVFFEPPRGLYDLAATKDEKGDWRFGIRLREGERVKLNLTLKEAISIEGRLLMLDDSDPHVAVPVQAIRNGKVIDGTLSDENGKYRFINLKPGRYQVRCQILDGYVYYGQGGKGVEGQKSKTQFGGTLQVEKGKTLKDINFRFAPFKKGRWKNYTPVDGLADNQLLAIHRAPDGMMWFGTEVGVSRYDGKEFRNFTTKDGLAGNEVNDIWCDSDGVMWFGTRGGVSRYDGKEFVNFTTKDGLAGNWVAAIHRDPDGVMWFGTEGGVSRYDGKEFKNFTTKDGLVRNSVNDIHSDPNGILWFGTFGGVSRYDGKEFKNFTTKDGLAGNRVVAIHRAPDGVMWFGAGYRVSRYDGKTFVNFTEKDGLASNSVVDICGDPDGAIWFATNMNGISRYNGKSFVNLTTKDGLRNNRVTSVYCTPDGDMWFGTWGGGASRYDGKELKNFTMEDGLAHNRVDAISCAPDGTMWFGTWGGISRYDGKEFVNFTTKDGLAGNWVVAIHRDPDGAMWFAMGGVGVARGVSRYDGKEFENLTPEDGLAHNKVYDIWGDSDGVIWFGTEGGVSQYDGKEFTNLTTKDGLADNWIQSIYRAQDGVMWFGTRFGGVSRYDGQAFLNFTAEDALTHNRVECIQRTSDGILWVGTGGGGICLYDGNTWASLDTRDGLAGNNVTSIQEDADGSLWFGTNGGITRYRRRSTKPKVSIVAVKTDKEYTADNHGELSLQAVPPIITGSRVTIRYSATDFVTLPEKRLYRYRIIKIPPNPPFSRGGLDSDWRRATKETSFDDSFDKPGEYTFEVQAIDRNLNYSDSASLPLKVALPFYLRLSFLAPSVSIGTILIAVLTILAFGYVKRRRQVQAYQQAAVLELKDAQKVQMGLMPKVAPPIEGVEIAGKCLPANTVSGDFFDYLEGKSQNELTLVVADVTGKAMKGAMNAVMTDGILRTAAMEQGQFTPASLMMTLNNALKGRLEQDTNVTMVIGTIDTEAKTLTLANAGHHAHPILLRLGLSSEANRNPKRIETNSEIQFLKAGGMPLGMMAGIEYTEEQFSLQSGDVLILMTDGIIEAMDREEQLYLDSGRLEETIRKLTIEQPAETMVEAIIADAIDFGGDKTTRDDDMTVMVAKIQ